MSYNEAAEERKFRIQTMTDRLSYHYQDERSRLPVPQPMDLPAAPQPEDLPAEKRR